MNGITPPHWHLLGAGHIGTWAAGHLLSAGHRVSVVRATDAPIVNARLIDADSGDETRLRLPVASPAALSAPLSHVVVACKTPFTETALARCLLAADATVIRLQNGVGTLDGRLPAGACLIEAVTTAAVKGQRDRHEIVADNETWMGGPAARPGWFAGLSEHWPGLQWTAHIRHRQWRKLVANAVINPLTALHDVPNGALLTETPLAEHAAALAAEADRLLARIDPTWPGDSLAGVQAIARATADNTSSMRADMARGAATEIEAINGWLLRQADTCGLALPAHAAIAEAVRRQSGRIRQR
ncbi:ketopantoate reductase family protein [Salinisphaera orenii]|uniref:2-dehydropantoate 2-reductase n=1 Tax=Salinisphaera orenii YIM 95161 TaxID=1051139 RepID=A0A423Q055_9GAMM|nr:2-dehydropantoate 2-reductase [Salinisphaera halophila]ROO31353.1 2-dehydropantoate 2-reductase [Salinisphaera halophila YIM 95161]